MPAPNLAVPNHLAQQKNQEAALQARAQGMHFQTSLDIYTKIVSNEYTMRCSQAAHELVKKADPFGVKNEEELDKELAGTSSPIMVDLNNAARMAIQAANVFLFHHKIIDRNGEVVVPGNPAEDEGSEQVESPIILG